MMRDEREGELPGPAKEDAWLTAQLRGVDSPCALFEPFEDAAVGISLAVEGVDGAALTGLATSRRDLMLSSFSGDGGLCVECNYVGRAQQYEFVSWGTFATE